MSGARTTDFAGEAVLGLLIEQCDHRFKLQRRLEARFPSAQFAHSTAYKAVDRLEKEGYVRAVGAGQDRRGVIYEATPEGIQHFRDWVCAPTSALVSRQELHAKIALCRPRELPRLIDVIYTEECAYAAELDRIRERTVAELGSDGPAASLAEREWPALMEEAVLHGEVAHLGGRIAQLSELRRYLEGLRAEAERRALSEHRRSLAEDRRTA
jgi:DNA-binding PadR family transcriptional regulator